MLVAQQTQMPSLTVGQKVFGRFRLTGKTFSCEVVSLPTGRKKKHRIKFLEKFGKNYSVGSEENIYGHHLWVNKDEPPADTNWSVKKSSTPKKNNSVKKSSKTFKEYKEDMEKTDFDFSLADKISLLVKWEKLNMTKEQIIAEITAKDEAILLEAKKQEELKKAEQEKKKKYQEFCKKKEEEMKEQWKKEFEAMSVQEAVEEIIEEEEEEEDCDGECEGQNMIEQLQEVKAKTLKEINEWFDENYEDFKKFKTKKKAVEKIDEEILELQNEM
jgi:colicin import membrane protein